MESISLTSHHVDSVKDDKLKPFRLRSDNPARWKGPPEQPTTKITLWGTMNWGLLFSSLVLIMASSLLLANGKCSKPQRTTTSFPVCVGGQLSLPSWLAIIGVEFFAVVLLVILPAQKVLISKLVSARLTSEGISLAKLLNSQNTAPLRTRFMHGLKTIFFVRALFLTVIFGMGVLYKFSFAKVRRSDTIILPVGKTPIRIGCNEAGLCDGISTNLAEALRGSYAASSINSTLSSSNSASLRRYIQVFGPSSPNTAEQIQEGDLQLCTPMYYSKNIILANTTQWAPPPINFTSAINSLRFPYPWDGFFLDIFSPNDTLQILTGVFDEAGAFGHYVSMLSASTQLCSGYASWRIDNTSPQSSFLQSPRDINCINEPFNLTTWVNSTSFSTQFPLGLLPGLSSMGNITTTPTTALNLILSTLNHTAAIDVLNAKYSSTMPNKSLALAPNICSLIPNSSTLTMVFTGMIPNHGTGFTLVGTLFQTSILIICTLSLLLLFQSTLPLITEWPAQWLGLVYGLSNKKVQEAVEGTSAGQNAVSGHVWVWLGSSGGEVLEGRPYLIVGEERNWVTMGRRHI